jgi:type IV pilus assembly protein PilV
MPMKIKQLHLRHLASPQQGVGMIEVLVALLVISIGMLGYAGLQLRALGSTEDAHFRTQATSIAQDLVERIAANPTALDLYLDDTVWEAATGVGAKPADWDDCHGASSTCDDAAMADSDILQIRWQAAQLLPGGRVGVSECVADGPICVVVSWRGLDPANCEPPAAECIRLEVVSWSL